jgi:ferrous iron transport protein A
MNTLVKTLDKLKPGHSAVIKSISPSPITIKLMEMGLLPDKEVRLNFRAPLGDPIAVTISGYSLALRLDEANKIELY